MKSERENINEHQKVYIKTFGCQMNKSDSELMQLSLQSAGFEIIDEELFADIVVFNTCSVREHAEKRAKSYIRSLRDQAGRKESAIKESGSKERIIVVTGCMAQRIGEKLVNDGIADIVIGPYQSPKIGDIIRAFIEDQRQFIYTSLAREDFESRFENNIKNSIDQISANSSSDWHKWIVITHGCCNYCSYCIVPYVRGPLISFRSDAIIEYINRAISSGINEITLLGQNVNQFGQDTGDIPFNKLLERCAQIDGLVRINFLTSHPKDFNEDIIHVIKDNPNISRAIHLPIQSGSDDILKLMNRKYTASHYLGIVEKIDRMLDNYSISTDIIVGFPGETDNDFNSTLRVVETVRFDEAFMYAYSRREGTSAYSLTEKITRAEKLNRLDRLISLQRRISQEKLLLRLNNTEEIIVEKISKRSEDEVMGKTFLNHPVIVQGGADDIGKKIKVKVTSLKGATLYGKRIA